MEKYTIDVRGIPVSKRVKRISKRLDGVPVGESLLIIADGNKVLQLVSEVIASTKTTEFVKLFKGEDGSYHIIVKKLHTRGLNRYVG